MRTPIITALAVATLAATPAGAHAANSVPTWDRHFLQDAAEGADFETDVQVADGELMEGGSGQAKALARTYRLAYQRHLAGFRLLAKHVSAW